MEYGESSMRWFSRGTGPKPIRFMFMCVENTGRSQMTAAFTDRERERRGVSEQIVIESGGTYLTDEVYDVVVEAMEEEGFDFSDRTPMVVRMGELKTVDFLVRLGCYVSEFDLSSYGVDSGEWSFAGPKDVDLGNTREIRDAIEVRVAELFDEIEEETQ